MITQVKAVALIAVGHSMKEGEQDTLVGHVGLALVILGISEILRTLDILGPPLSREPPAGG